ncbi:ABC transporter ATP-binding protein [Nibricoccus sp. IMCC34717]|uniref:ABC transporter ATP-binding protein n=1 Tax=Nibricoccus sp. IMCC34717 TaxID=3034021 RepID=UPI00384E313C
MLKQAETVFQVRELTRDYGNGRGIAAVSFTLNAGDIVALLGANGAGKTTLIETALGLRERDSGDCVACGVSLCTEPERYRTLVGAQLQDEAHLGYLTPLETVRLHSAFRASGEPAPATLERVGLGEQAGVRNDVLSGGQRQRLSVALAFIGRPRVLLLDEPTAGIDAEGRELLARALREFSKAGGAVLFTTHIREDQALATRTVTISGGRLAEDSA